MRSSQKEKSHPWRICPGGEHWVRTHDRRVSISEKNPTGITEVEGHCRKNRSKKDIEDPNVNICAGTRWLFHKKKLASAKLKREATWIEAAAEYKSYLKDLRSGKIPKNFQDFLKWYEDLKK